MIHLLGVFFFKELDLAFIDRGYGLDEELILFDTDDVDPGDETVFVDVLRMFAEDFLDIGQGVRHFLTEDPRPRRACDFRRVELGHGVPPSCFGRTARLRGVVGRSYFVRRITVIGSRTEQDTVA